MQLLLRLAVWGLFVLAFFTFVGAAMTFAGGGSEALVALLNVLLGVVFVAVALYLRSKSAG